MESNEKYSISCVVDNMQPEIKAIQEKDIRQRLLCDLEEVICSGETITIKVTREEHQEMICSGETTTIKVTREEHQEMHNFYSCPAASRVTYTAIYCEHGHSTGNANYDKCGAVQKIYGQKSQEERQSKGAHGKSAAP